MNEKILPLDTNPVIQSQSNIADLCCILGKTKYFDNWLCSNFYHNRYVNHVVHSHILTLPSPIYEDCELIEFDYKILKDKLSYDEIIKLIIKYIDDDRYLIIEVDEMLLPRCRAFNRYNNVHRQLFYGYSKTKSLLYFMCYNENNLYIPSEVSFSEFFESLKSAVPYAPIMTLKVRDVEYNLKIDRIAHEFKSYCNIIKVQNNNDFHWYGISAAEKFKDAFHDILNGGKRDNYLIDISYLRDHKNILRLKLTILQQFGINFSEEVLSMADKICDYAKISVNLFIKYSQTKNKKYIKNIIDNIDNIISTEKELYMMLYESMYSYLMQIGMNKVNGCNSRELIYYIRI